MQPAEIAPYHRHVKSGKPNTWEMLTREGEPRVLPVELVSEAGRMLDGRPIFLSYDVEGNQYLVVKPYGGRFCIYEPDTGKIMETQRNGIPCVRFELLHVPDFEPGGELESFFNEVLSTR